MPAPKMSKSSLIQPMIDLAISRIMTNGHEVNEAIKAYSTDDQI
jgi:hypothetical protein